MASNFILFSRFSMSLNSIGDIIPVKQSEEDLERMRKNLDELVKDWVQDSKKQSSKEIPKSKKPQKVHSDFENMDDDLPF